MGDSVANCLHGDPARLDKNFDADKFFFLYVFYSNSSYMTSNFSDFYLQRLMVYVSFLMVSSSRTFVTGRRPFVGVSKKFHQSNTVVEEGPIVSSGYIS